MLNIDCVMIEGMVRIDMTGNYMGDGYGVWRNYNIMI
jgi:hypothetical protein